MDMIYTQYVTQMHMVQKATDVMLGYNTACLQLHFQINLKLCQQ